LLLLQTGGEGKLTMLTSSSIDSRGMLPVFCMRDVDASRLPSASNRRRRTAAPPATRVVVDRIPYLPGLFPRLPRTASILTEF